MDRKKTIVAAVMINAAILTVLFIAAMTMREVPDSQTQRLGAGASEPTLQFKEIVEIPAAVPVPVALSPAVAGNSAVLPTPPVAFSLPPSALVDPGTATSAPHEPAASTLVAPIANAAKQTTGSEIEVQKGDSLEKLAKQYRTSVDEIIQLNQLPSSFLKVGQRLKLPAGKSLDISKPKSGTGLETAEYYTMKVGDNPWSVAMKNHMKVDELLKLNGLNEKTARKLKPGDRLKIK